MNFEFATANQILFGNGVMKQVPGLAAQYGRKVFLLTGSSPERCAGLIDALQDKSLELTIHGIGKGEPTVRMAEQAVEQARLAEADVVIGYGGGSVLDLGKVVAAMLTNDGELMDYLEVIGRAQPLANHSAPYIAITTTAGTGSEVTRNAVLDSPDHKVKVSMRSPYMLPAVAVVDPELTWSMPAQLTACTGLDALTQVIEPLLSNKSNPLTDSLCREGIRRAGQSLRLVYDEPGNSQAREDMSLVNLFGGLALANAKLGAVHGFAGPLGGMFHAPHGALCARLLPLVMECNLRALQERTPDSPYIERFDEVARLLTGNPSATAEDGNTWIREICEHMQIPPLSCYGMSAEHVDEAIAKSKNSSSMKGNPIELTEAEMKDILNRAL
ncbi:iron-containing alcohol dehydrogenase [Hahella sp. CCB-MM4]|uniref:iron-containing alcohol dehydrogenase n=1 Tax=Hahella sp. (strain CCB-MM4) TaxID=1926491 RepID=UPI000B9C08B2|nr:iron-containing alcohol dehydrogenase [Hahella sp. CCB-MM4]